MNKKEIKKYLNNNIVDDDSYESNLKSLKKVETFFRLNKFNFNLDDAIGFITSSKSLNKLIENVYKNNEMLVTKKGIETITSDDNIMMLFEAYFVINGIELNIKDMNNSVTDDAYDDYVKKLDRVSLTKEQEISFIKRIRENDRVAYDIFIENNIALVIKIAKRYLGFGLEMMDLVQEGTIGLMEAIKRFDINKGYRFSTYAVPWIRQAVGRAVAKDGRLIRLPVHLYEEYVKYSMIRNEYSMKYGEDPTISQMCEYSNFSEDKVEQMMLLSGNMVSLDSKINQVEDDRNDELWTIIPDNYDLQDEVETNVSSEELMEFIENINLDEKSIHILKLRNGFINGKIYTLQEIADMYNVTRERIRQIESSALRKIRNSIRINRIIDFSSNSTLAQKKIKLYKGKIYKNTDFMAGKKEDLF